MLRNNSGLGQHSLRTRGRDARHDWDAFCVGVTVEPIRRTAVEQLQCFRMKSGHSKFAIRWKLFAVDRQRDSFESPHRIPGASCFGRTQEQLDAALSCVRQYYARYHRSLRTSAITGTGQTPSVLWRGCYPRVLKPGEPLSSIFSLALIVQLWSIQWYPARAPRAPASDLIGDFI